jgi:hypothetical protein
MAALVSRAESHLAVEEGFAIVFAKFHHLGSLPDEARIALNQISADTVSFPDTTHFAVLLDLPAFRLISVARDGEILSLGDNSAAIPSATVFLQLIEPAEPEGFGKSDEE